MQMQRARPIVMLFVLMGVHVSPTPIGAFETVAAADAVRTVTKTEDRISLSCRCTQYGLFETL